MATAVPACAIVVLSAAPSHAQVCAAIRSGASAYVGSDIDPELLVHTVRSALAGEAVIPTATARWIMARLQAGIPADEAPDDYGTRRLTERHWQVLALLERSLTTAQIADELGVSPVTIRRHRSEIRARSRQSAGCAREAGSTAGQAPS